MTGILITAILFLLNATIAFALIVQVHDLWNLGQTLLGFISLSLAVINAYCAIDGIERLSERIKEYNNG